MKNISRENILTEIKNGNEEVLVYLSQKYFPSSRRFLRGMGVRDERTPVVFAEALTSVYLDLQHQQSHHVDFESFFQNALKVKAKAEKLDTLSSSPTRTKTDEVASNCVSILDDETQRLLFARIVSRLSYEDIKVRFNFSNAVIAQYEVNKALAQIEGIVKLRLNLS